jgi:hypothetical protein
MLAGALGIWPSIRQFVRQLEKGEVTNRHGIRLYRTRGWRADSRYSANSRLREVSRGLASYDRREGLYGVSDSRTRLVGRLV